MHAERKMGGCDFSFFGGKKSFVLFVVGCNIFYAGYLYNHVP